MLRWIENRQILMNKWIDVLRLIENTTDTNK